MDEPDQMMSSAFHDNIPQYPNFGTNFGDHKVYRAAQNSIIYNAAPAFHGIQTNIMPEYTEYNGGGDPDFNHLLNDNQSKHFDKYESSEGVIPYDNAMHPTGISLPYEGRRHSFAIIYDEEKENTYF